MHGHHITPSQYWVLQESESWIESSFDSMLIGWIVDDHEDDMCFHFNNFDQLIAVHLDLMCSEEGHQWLLQLLKEPDTELENSNIIFHCELVSLLADLCQHHAANQMLCHALLSWHELAKNKLSILSSSAISRIVDGHSCGDTSQAAAATAVQAACATPAGDIHTRI